MHFLKHCIYDLNCLQLLMFNMFFLSGKLSKKDRVFQRTQGKSVFSRVNSGKKIYFSKKLIEKFPKKLSETGTSWKRTNGSKLMKSEMLKAMFGSDVFGSLYLPVRKSDLNIVFWYLPLSELPCFVHAVESLHQSKKLSVIHFLKER